MAPDDTRRCRRLMVSGRAAGPAFRWHRLGEPRLATKPLAGFAGTRRTDGKDFPHERPRQWNHPAQLPERGDGRRRRGDRRGDRPPCGRVGVLASAGQGDAATPSTWARSSHSHPNRDSPPLRRTTSRIRRSPWSEPGPPNATALDNRTMTGWRRTPCRRVSNRARMSAAPRQATGVGLLRAPATRASSTSRAPGSPARPYVRVHRFQWQIRAGGHLWLTERWSVRIQGGQVRYYPVKSPGQPLAGQLPSRPPPTSRTRRLRTPRERFLPRPAADRSVADSPIAPGPPGAVAFDCSRAGMGGRPYQPGPFQGPDHQPGGVRLAAHPVVGHGRERVMVVVPALTEREHGDSRLFRLYHRSNGCDPKRGRPS